MKYVVVVCALCMLAFAACEGMDRVVDSSGKTNNGGIPEGIPEEVKKVKEGSFAVNETGGSLVGFDYTDINGNLEIRNTDLVHLNELIVLKRVTGNIVIEHTIYLTNINGLQGLLFVGGDMIFADNDKIIEQKIITVVQAIYTNGGQIIGNVILDGVTLDINMILNTTI